MLTISFGSITLITILAVALLERLDTTEYTRVQHALLTASLVSGGLMVILLVTTMFTGNVY